MEFNVTGLMRGSRVQCSTTERHATTGHRVMLAPATPQHLPLASLATTWGAEVQPGGKLLSVMVASVRPCLHLISRRCISSFPHLSSSVISWPDTIDDRSPTSPTMFSSTRRWLRQNRTPIAVGVGVIGAGYVVTQYVLSKINDARERMSSDRIAKEK